MEKRNSCNLLNGGTSYQVKEQKEYKIYIQKREKLFYEVVPATINDAEYIIEKGKTKVVESYNRRKDVIEKYNNKIKVKE